MRKLFTTLVLVMIAAAAAAQIKVPGTNVEFNLPTNEWKYLQTTKVDKNTNVYLYSYNARNVIDQEGDTIIPFLRIYVRKNYTKSVYDLAYDRFTAQPFQALDEYTEGLPNSGIGYIGAYSSAYDEKDHQFRMIYFKDRNTALEFRAETTVDTYNDFADTFKKILESIQIH